MTTALIDPKNRCVFCWSDLRRTAKGKGKAEEHVVPKWLAEDLGIRYTPITPMRVSTESGNILDRREHTVGNLVAGNVCSGCNNGWMSDLEGVAKPILINLIADPKRLSVLSADERLVVARWTLKTVGVLNRSSTHGDLKNPDARPVPDEHLEGVRSGRMPDRVMILAGGYPKSKPFDWLQFATWATPKSAAALPEEDRNRSYKIAVSFNDLILAAVYYPATGYKYSGVEGYRVPIWTGDQSCLPIDHPGLDAPTVSNSPALEVFLMNVYVISDTWLTLASMPTITKLTR